MRMEIAEDKTLARFVSDSVFRDKELLLSIPGMRYTKGEFRAPLTWATAVTARGVFGERLTLSDEVTEWGFELAQARITPCLTLRDAVEPSSDEFYDERLYPFQKAGVEFLTTAGSAVLGDEMGSGKTVQLASALRELGDAALPALVIAPKSMLLTWEKELAKWYPEAEAQVISGTAAQRRKQLASDADIFIINWEGVASHSRLAPYGNLRLARCSNCDKTSLVKPASCEVCPRELNNIGFRTVVADEAHRLKNPKAKQTRAVWAVAAKADHRFALTGTPLASSILDFWSILHFVDPKEWPARTRFIDRWCEVEHNPWSGGVNVIGLKEARKEEFFKIAGPRLRRMPKEVVLPQLPKKTVTYLHSDMSPRQAKAYGQMVEHMMAEVDDGMILATNSLTKYTRLSQFASAMIDEEGNMQAPSNKVETFMQLFEDSGRVPMVVFALHRGLIDMLAARLDKEKITYSTIVGGQTALQREEAKNDFQEGRVNLILCTIQAGGVAITLTRAGTAVFLERSWSMIDNKQAEDRIHRIGSDKLHDKVQIIYLVAPGTIEASRQHERLEEKSEALEELVRDRETALKFFRGEK